MKVDARIVTQARRKFRREGLAVSFDYSPETSQLTKGKGTKHENYDAFVALVKELKKEHDERAAAYESGRAKLVELGLTELEVEMLFVKQVRGDFRKRG